MDDSSILPRFFILLILLFVSAFFAACEAAFFSLNRLQLAELKEKKGRAGRRVHSLLEKPHELLITIYIGNELVNVAVAAVTTSIAIKIFGSIGIGIAVGLGTFLILVFGEITPKTLSFRFAGTFALFAAYPLTLFYKLVHPIQNLFTRVINRLILTLGLRPIKPRESVITDEELITMVKMGEGEGIIDPEEREMIHNIIEFGETTVADIMTPRIDMFTVRVDESLEEILPKITENFYSRVPVYDQEEKNIIGILFTKDLNRVKQLPRENVNLKNILHSVLSVPESKKIKELLQEFRKMKRHMAIVLDEYGSVSGLVTLEDILEELVGEIDSEMRRDEVPLVKLNDTHYRVSATFSLAEFNEHFHSNLPEEHHDTVGGFVFGQFGRIPRSGEAVSYENFKFRVEKMKGPRILKIHLTLMKTETPTGNGGEPRETAPA